MNNLWKLRLQDECILALGGPIQDGIISPKLSNYMCQEFCIDFVPKEIDAIPKRASKFHLPTTRSIKCGIARVKVTRI